MSTTARRAARALVAVVIAAGAGACSLPATLVPPEPSAGVDVDVAGGGVGDGSLPQPRIAPPDSGRPRYVRDDWQPHGWADADGDGCNTREEVLIAQSRTPVATGAGCKILAGEWLDPFTGRVATSASQLEVDHLVALADAHRSGGWAWAPERKVAFANDLDNPELHAVWGAENQAKADDGPDGWLPPNQAWRCQYVLAYATVKVRWDLSATAEQWAAMQRVWAGCRP